MEFVVRTILQVFVGLTLASLSFSCLAQEKALADPDHWKIRGGVGYGSAPGDRTTDAMPEVDPDIRQELVAQLRRSITIFLGRPAKGPLDEIAMLDWSSGFHTATFAGFAYTQEMARIEGWSIDVEAGIGGVFGQGESNDAVQYWTGAFLRYSAFPWNEIIKTSIAANIGLSYSTKQLATERRGRENRTKRLLHYLGPEITLASPKRPDTELVLRLHHRSPVFGLFGCRRCSSNILAAGLRKNF